MQIIFFSYLCIRYNKIPKRDTMLINYCKVNIFQDEKQVLKDVNFQVGEGEFIYIIGKVGSGKSSLLKTFIVNLIFMQKMQKLQMFWDNLY